MLNGRGELSSYRMLADEEAAEETLLYAYLRTLPQSPRFNDTAYADLLQKETIDRFIEVTHERFAAAVGKDFGAAVPAIFTDEPQYSKGASLNLPDSLGEVNLLLPFTGTLDKRIITLKGRWQATLYDTLTGDIRPYPVTLQGENTVIRQNFYPYDSLLLQLSPATEAIAPLTVGEKSAEIAVPLPADAAFTLHEPNALLLDVAEYAVDGGEWQAAEEILRADNAICAALGLRVQNGSDCQPWCLPKEVLTHTVALRFTVESDVDLTDVSLASELPDDGKILLDGKELPIGPTAITWILPSDALSCPRFRAADTRLSCTSPTASAPHSNGAICWVASAYPSRDVKSA